MAILIKREGSPYWIAAFDVTMPDGTTRRLKKSTKRAKQGEAMIEAIRIEETAKMGNVSNDDSAKKAYNILSEAAEAAAKGELSEGRARGFLSRLCEVSNGSPLRFYTVRSWADDWLAMKAATGKKATLARYTAHVEMFIKWLGDKADAKLEAITKAEIRAFRDDIRKGWVPEVVEPPAKKGKKSEKQLPPPLRTAKTTNHYASDVASMFRSAVREGLLLASPASALDRLPESDSTEREVFSAAEVSQLVNQAGLPDWQDNVFFSTKDQVEERAARCADWQGMILVGFYAGVRLGDCAKLTWGNVNLSHKTLSFIPAKTERKRKRLEVPLHDRLISWLQGCEQPKDDSTPLFPALFACPIGGRHGLSSQFIAIMDAAKIGRKTVRAAENGRRAQHARSFHSLRHSLTSQLANLDVPEEIRRRIVGHESAEVHAGYTHHERETLARAVGKMPSV